MLEYRRAPRYCVQVLVDQEISSGGRTVPWCTKHCGITQLRHPPSMNMCWRLYCILYLSAVSQRLASAGLGLVIDNRLRTPAIGVILPPPSTWKWAWTENEWHPIVSSDESHFSINSDDHRVWVKRCPGQKADHSHIVGKHSGIIFDIIVWGAIGYEFSSHLIVLWQILTAQRFVSDILHPHVLPLTAQHPGEVFQQDNARPHTARDPMIRLEEVQFLLWPTSYPDFSIIEHVWDDIGRGLCHSTNLRDLEGQVQ